MDAENQAHASSQLAVHEQVEAIEARGRASSRRCENVATVIEPSSFFTRDCLAKLELLDQSVGAKTRHDMMEPDVLDAGDILTIQQAAKAITDFVGLREARPIVAIAAQKDGVGGHVSLNHDREFYIEISRDTLAFREAALATLAHEVTHKYLYENGITCGTGPVKEYENEVLTDIAAVFLGLGKLLLNGCAARGPADTGYLFDESILNSGYLNRQQLAYVYCVVCAMHGITRRNAERNLCKEALAAVRECRIRSKRTIDPRLHAAIQRLARDLWHKTRRVFRHR